MSRSQLAAALTVVLSAVVMPSIHAQDHGPNPNELSGPTPFQAQAPDQPVWVPPMPMMPQQASYLRGQAPMMGQSPTPIDANQQAGNYGGMAPAQQQGYVQLGAPMYPSPRPNIPIWTGSTVITNQAFAPQEMLYPHTYRSIYPPYYHRVKGGWILTPLGVRSHEKWELQGTTVEVKYRSTQPGILSGSAWFPPATSYRHGSWR